MAKFLQAVNGLPRMTDIPSSPTIYERSLTVVSSGAGTGEINLADVTAGTPITLPDSQTYNSQELYVRVNGVKLTVTMEYNYVGTNPRTQIAMVYDLTVGDVLEFRIDRSF